MKTGWYIGLTISAVMVIGRIIIFATDTGESRISTFKKRLIREKISLDLQKHL